MWARGGTGLTAPWQRAWPGSRKGHVLVSTVCGRGQSSSPVPVVVLAEHSRITHHDQQSLGPGDGHVKPLKRTSKRALPGCITSHPLPAPPGCRELWCGTEHPEQLYLPVKTRGKKGMPRKKGLLGAMWYLGVLEEAQPEGLVELEVCAAAAHGGDEDHVPLLALELLHRAHLGQGQQVRGQEHPWAGAGRAPSSCGRVCSSPLNAQDLPSTG